MLTKYGKRILLVLLVIVCLPIASLQAKEPTKEPTPKIAANGYAFDLNSEQAILIDLTDQKILYQKDANKRIHPASMTKIMTALVAVENIEDFDKTILLNEEVFEGLLEANASVAGFLYHEEVTMQELLYATMIASGADAARALAIAVSGSEADFVKRMNKKAKTLGLNNTHFVNTTGLDDDDHYSTVSDIAKLLEAAIQNKQFLEIFKAREYTLQSNEVRTEAIHLESTMLGQIKKLGYEDSLIEGGKTGFTEGGGLCLASTAWHDGTHYLAVSANGGLDTNSGNNVMDAYTMYQYYFENYKRKTIVKKGAVYLTLPVKWNFSKSHLEFKADKAITTLVPKDMKEDELKKHFIGEKTVKTPIENQKLLGQLEFMYGNELLASLEIRAAEEVGRNPLLYYSEPVLNFFKENALASVLLIAACFGVVIVIIWRRKYRRYL